MRKVEEIVLEFKSGAGDEKKTMEELFRHVEVNLKRLAALFSRNETLQNDLIQEAYLAIRPALDKFNVDSGTCFKTYYFYWAKKMMHDFVRNNRHPFNLSMHFQNTKPVQEIINYELIQDDLPEEANKKDENMILKIGLLINQLPEKDQNIIKSRYGIGTIKKSLRELSEETGDGLGKINSAQKKIEKKLKKQLLPFCS